MARVRLEIHCASEKEVESVRRAVIDFIDHALGTGHLTIMEDNRGRQSHPVVAMEFRTKTDPRAPGDLGVVVT